MLKEFFICVHCALAEKYSINKIPFVFLLVPRLSKELILVHLKSIVRRQRGFDLDSFLLGALRGALIHF